MATASGFSFLPAPLHWWVSFPCGDFFLASLCSVFCSFFCSCQLFLPVVSSLRAPLRFLVLLLCGGRSFGISSSAPFFPSRSPSSPALCLPVQCGPVWLGRFVFPVRHCAWCPDSAPPLRSSLRPSALLGSRCCAAGFSLPVPVPSLPALSPCLRSLPRLPMSLGSPTALSVPRRPFVLFGVLYSPLVCSFLGSSA